jgi:hypothetical protein
VVFSEARDHQLGWCAVQLDPPVVAVGRLHGDTPSEDAELCIGLSGSRVVGFDAHGHVIPFGAPTLSALLP